MRSAFTLIEQLAATALAALLIAASVAVLARAARDRARAAQPDLSVTITAIANLVRWDLTNAQRVRPGRSALVLAGFDSLDRHSLLPTHRPVRVIYQIEQVGSKYRLIRTQTDIDARSNRNTVSQLVAVGIMALELAPTGPRRAQSTQPIGNLFGSADGEVVPDAAVLALRLEDGREFRRVLSIR